MKRALGLPGSVPALAYMALLFFLSSIPGQPRSDSPGSSLLDNLPATLQNLLHIPQFAVLSWLWGRAGLGLGLVALLSGTYALFDELYQHTVPGRYSSASDLGLDMIGIAVGIWVSRRWSSPGPIDDSGGGSK